MKKFENANIYVCGQGIIKTDLSFGEKIVSIGAGASGEKIELPQNAIVVPAFIDVHVHGADGADFMDGTLSAYETVDGALAKEGTARYLATTMTQSEDKILKTLEAAAKFSKRSNGFCGVHLEGPFISPEYAGAQPLDYIKNPDVLLFKKFYGAADGVIKNLTLAPERDGALNFIRYLKMTGVGVSLGHTHATNLQIESAMLAGADKITHTFNAQSGIHHREIGTAGSALLYDGLYCELICDGLHLSYPAVKLLLKCKPREKVILITDSMRAKGLEDGVSELGGQTVYVKDGQARLEDGTLAGSVLKMNEAVKNLVEKVGVPIETAIDFASCNPAKYLGLDDCGSIKINNRADFTVLGDDFKVLYTIRDGAIIYVGR